MNYSKLKQLIKEEIRKKLREDAASKLYKIVGKLVTNTNIKTQTQILSDIRSITGVTTIDAKSYTPGITPKQGYDYNILTVKIDPYPYIKNGNLFNEETLIQISDSISKVRGVVAFKINEDELELTNIGI
jgi:hypothetical protein